MSPAADSDIHLKNMLDRIGELERDVKDSKESANSALAKIDLHEQICAMRYKEIVLLVRITIILVLLFGAMAFPQAWPHLAPLLGIVTK